MIKEVLSILPKWRIIHLLGISKLRERYARSVFGQVWLVMANAIFILVLGIIWSLIWKMPLDEYLPYVGVGHVVYLYIATTLNEATGIFVSDSRYYLNEKNSFFLSVSAHLYRSALIFIHNIPLMIFLVVWSDSASFSPDYLFMLFGSLILFIFLFFWIYVLAVISTRYRDLIQLFGLIFQLAFLISPVMWNLEMLPIEYRDYFMINPIAAFLEIVRNPIIGSPVIASAYISAILWTLAGIWAAFISYRVLGKKIIFWV
jgi:lipopolysaccharide transport system permease protein